MSEIAAAQAVAVTLEEMTVRLVRMYSDFALESQFRVYRDIGRDRASKPFQYARQEFLRGVLQEQLELLS